MLEVTLLGVNGKEYDLTGSERTSPVLAPEATLEGLVGRPTRTDLAIPGRSGVIPGKRRFGAIETELSFYLHNMNGELDMEEVYKDFRQAWSLDDPTQVKINADHPLGDFVSDLQLAQVIPGVPVDMRKRSSTVVRVSVFDPGGLFRSMPLTGTGTVTVTNTGDGIVYPKLTYSGLGGEVISPSGARFTLPPVGELTVIDLDPQYLRLDGVFPEGVPPKKSGTWVLPAGVTASWEILVSDPWA